MRPYLKLVAINAFVLFTVFNVVIWTICLGYSIYNLSPKSDELASFMAARKAKLPNYAGIAWAQTHFEEFASLSTKYVSYIGWRREPFSGKTITLVGAYNQRETIGSADPGKPSVYFFGGSTMWGSGADDANTIASLVTQLGGFRSANYGEVAYTAHQSLTLLIQLLQDGHRPDVVVFYDGANEVLHKCRADLTPTSHAREARIRNALEATKSANMYGLHYMLGPLAILARRVSEQVFRPVRDYSRQYHCHTDGGRAERIAEYLVQDWDVARRLVESYGGKFVGILQPVAFYSDTKLDHIKLMDAQRKQYLAVYPRIKERMAGRPRLYDFTDVLNRQEYIYTDFCHLSPNGNRYLAQRIVEVLAD